MFRSIQWRITFFFILVIVVTMGALGIYLVSSTRNAQIDSLRSQLESEARLTAEASLAGFLSPDGSGERVVYMVTGKMEEIGISKYSGGMGGRKPGGAGL